MHPLPPHGAVVSIEAVNFPTEHVVRRNSILPAGSGGVAGGFQYCRGEEDLVVPDNRRRPAAAWHTHFPTQVLRSAPHRWERIALNHAIAGRATELRPEALTLAVRSRLNKSVTQRCDGWNMGAAERGCSARSASRTRGSLREPARRSNSPGDAKILQRSLRHVPAKVSR
jgi:hypothetical protein